MCSVWGSEAGSYACNRNSDPTLSRTLVLTLPLIPALVLLVPVYLQQGHVRVLSVLPLPCFLILLRPSL